MMLKRLEARAGRTVTSPALIVALRASFLCRQRVSQLPICASIGCMWVAAAL